MGLFKWIKESVEFERERQQVIAEADKVLASANETPAPKPEVDEESPRPAAWYECNLSGIKKDMFEPFFEKNDAYDIPYDEMKLRYDLHDKIYEYVFHPDPQEITIDKVDDKYHVFWKGEDIGRVAQKATYDIDQLKPSHDFLLFNVQILKGGVRKIVRNDYYGDETFDPDDPDFLWVENDYVDKPKGKLSIGIKRKS